MMNDMMIRLSTLFLLLWGLSGCRCTSTPADQKSQETSQLVAVVTSVEQAVKLVQQFERERNDQLYGKDKPHPPLASGEEPHSVVEKGEYYVFEFRKPFGPAGGGYIKTFHVHKPTGKVTRGAWQLGR